MPGDSAQDLIDELDALLDSERGALLSGDLDGVARLTARKQDVFDRLNTLGSAEADGMAPVQAKIARNQALLHGAAEGIRAIADRMAEIRQLRRGFETYDRTGRRTTVAAPPPSRVEKKA